MERVLVLAHQDDSTACQMLSMPPNCNAIVKVGCETQVASLILERAGAQRYKCPHVLEGGSIHVDGEGCGLCCSTDDIIVLSCPASTSILTPEAVGWCHHLTR